MPLVNAKCPNCGGTLQVNNNNDAAICNYCGTPFIVEKAIKNYNTVNHNHISDSIVNIYSKNELNAGEYLNKALEYMRIDEFEDARKNIKEARRIAPADDKILFFYIIINGQYHLIELVENYFQKYPEIQIWEIDFLNEICSYEKTLQTKLGNYYFYNFWSCVWDKKRIAKLLRLGLIKIESFYDCLYELDSNYEKSYERLELFLKYNQDQDSNPYLNNYQCIHGMYFSLYDYFYFGSRENIDKMKPQPDLKFLQLIEKYYPIPQEISQYPNFIERIGIMKNVCPCCNNKLSMFGKCNTPRCSWYKKSIYKKKIF